MPFSETRMELKIKMAFRERKMKWGIKMGPGRKTGMGSQIKIVFRERKMKLNVKTVVGDDDGDKIKHWNGILGAPNKIKD